MKPLRPADYHAMPWKDGGGVTEEIAIEPRGASVADPFLWRLSMARVERNGPFSRFPGYDRTLLLLEGEGMDIDFGEHGRAELGGPYQPVSFSGDWAASGVLHRGPVKDFNVISHRSRVRHSLQVLILKDQTIDVPASPTTWVFGLQGQVHIDRVPVGPMEALRLDKTAFTLLAKDRCCVLLIQFDPAE